MPNSLLFSPYIVTLKLLWLCNNRWGNNLYVDSCIKHHNWPKL